MFEPTDEQLSESARYEAARTFREERRRDPGRRMTIEWLNLNNPAFGCKRADPNDRRPYPETIRHGS